jgi:ferritin
MINKTMQDAINEQIKHEFYSAYLYLSMAANCEAANLSGFGNWMRVQHQEETAHAMKLFDHVIDRGGRVTLQAIDQPPAEFQSQLEMMQLVVGHERKVTGLIHRLYDLAVKESDPATQVLLQWFITEQVEEEKTAGQIAEQLKMIGDQGVALLMLDRELGTRVAGMEAEAGGGG